MKQFNKIGVTTGGYRGNRAILEQRVIEGFKQPKFEDNLLQLTPESEETQYLNTNNMTTGNYIVLPNAKDLWLNWKVTIINDSEDPVSIYYYTNDYSNLQLLKEINPANMCTFILLDNSSTDGIWTTLRTTEYTAASQVEKYTSDVLDTIEINWNQIQGAQSPLVFNLAPVLAGTAVKSIYVKTLEKFAASDSDESDDNLTLKVSIGTGSDESDEDYDDDYFIKDYDLTAAVSETNFTKDLFDEILSTSENKYICATIVGNDFSNLSAGRLQITIERAKLIDPTVLKNPILQTSLPIGTVMNYIFNDMPEGFLRLNGDVYPNAAAAFPQFVQKLTEVNNQLVGDKLIVGIDEWNNIYNAYGSCGKFAWIGSSLKFPEINCFIQGVSDLSQLSKLTPAGLPNIIGTASVQPAMNSNYRTGAFYTSANNIKVDSGSSNSSSYQNLAFDASRSNAIYGNSDTVTPLNIKYPYIISVYNKMQNASVIDFNALLEDSVYKANITLDNIGAIDPSFSIKMNEYNIRTVVDTYYNLDSTNGSTWYRVWSDGWVEQGGAVYVNSAGKIVNLLLPMADDQYTCTSTGGTRPYGNTCMYDQTTTSFLAWTSDDNSFNAGWLYWKVEGKGANI